MNISTIPSGIERFIIGYHRLDLGVPVVGEYGNNGGELSRSFSSLVPGAKYRITAWGLGGGDDRRRSRSPAVEEVTTMEQMEQSIDTPTHGLETRATVWIHACCTVDIRYVIDRTNFVCRGGELVRDNMR